MNKENIPDREYENVRKIRWYKTIILLLLPLLMLIIPLFKPGHIEPLYIFPNTSNFLSLPYMDDVMGGCSTIDDYYFNLLYTIFYSVFN